MQNWKIYDLEQKIIFILFTILIIIAAVISLLMLRYAGELWSWVTIFWVTLLSNSFIAIPHEPFYIEMGKSEPIYLLLLISIIPTIMGCMLDYMILKPMIFSKRLSRIRNHRQVNKYGKWFQKYPGFLIFIFAVSPLPFYVVRILSLVTNYPYIKYALYSLSGRLPRYCLLAIFGLSLKPPTWTVMLLFILLFILPWSMKLYKYLLRR